MGLFDKFKKENIEESIAVMPKLDENAWKDILSSCLGKAIAIQLACLDIVVKEQNWNVDFSEGTISFGESKYPIQFIGSESTSDNTWLWGWENINGFSDEIISVANHVKEIGEKQNIEPLITAEIPLDDELNGHNLSMVACGLVDDYCYYRGPHDGGAIFVAFSDVPKEVFNPVDSLKFTSITMQCIEQANINHKIFVESFLEWNKTKYDWNNTTLTAYFQHEMQIEFEQVADCLRIKNITSKQG